MAMDNTLKIVRAIPGSDRKKDPDNRWGTAGDLDFPCHKCGAGLHWARARSNGHIRAWCDTADCFRVIA